MFDKNGIKKNNKGIKQTKKDKKNKRIPFLLVIK